MSIESNIERGESAPFSSPAEQVLGNMPEFSQRDSIVGRVNSITSEALDSKINISSAKELLCRINGVINGIEQSEIVDSGEVVGAYSSAGAEYVAPNKMIRNEIAKNYLDSINIEMDKDKKAKLAYYAIINMHLFEDGNGRTARAAYLTIKNGKISEKDSAFLQHGKEAKGSDEFEDNTDMEPSWMIDARATAKVLASEIEEGKLSKWIDAFVRENGPASIHTYAQPEQKELSDMGLDENERKVLRDIFDDNYLAGYATVELLLEDGATEALFEKNIVNPGSVINYKRLTFTHSKNKSEKYNSVFGSMTAEQYRRLIGIYNNLKIKQNDKVIEIVQSQ